MKSAFDIEKIRNDFAQKHKLRALKKTYSATFPRIDNINTKYFWDKKIVRHRASLKSYPMYEDKLNIVSKYFSIQNGSLLDLGFGWANLEEKICKYSKLEIFGIDLSIKAVLYAQKHFRGEYRAGSIFDIPYTKNKFDFVVALDILEHVSADKIFKVYKSVSKILKANGKFIVSVPVNEDLEGLIKMKKNTIGHVRSYSPALIKAELKLAGFRIEKEYYLYAFASFYKIKKFMMKILPFRVRDPNLIIIIANK